MGRPRARSWSATPSTENRRFFPFVNRSDTSPLMGNGNFSGGHDTDQRRWNTPHFDSGTYSVNSDCTRAQFPSLPGRLENEYRDYQWGPRVKYLGANTGNINSGTLRLMTASCSASILSATRMAMHGGLVGAGVAIASRASAGSCPRACRSDFIRGYGSISGVDNAISAACLCPANLLRVPT